MDERQQIEGQEPEGSATGQEPVAPAVVPATWNISSLPPAAQEYIDALRKEAASYRIKAKKAAESHKAVADALAEKEAAEKEAATRALAAKEEWKELAEQRAAELEEMIPYKAQAERLLATVVASNEKRLEDIPERFRSLIPAFDDPTKLSEWLDAAAKELVAPAQAPNLDPGGPPAGVGAAEAAKKLTPEQKTWADALGLSYDVYAARLEP